MKTIIARIGNSLIGFPHEEVIYISPPKIHEVPEAPPGILGAVVYREKIYTAIAFHGIMGGKKIAAFVLTKNGYAIGIEEIIGMYELSEIAELSKDFKKFFEKAYLFENKPVYIVKTSEGLEIPKFPENLELDVSSLEEYQSEVISKETEQFLIIENDEESFALKSSEVQEILSAKLMNCFPLGNLMGFIESNKKPFPVVKIWEIEKPKWIVILEKIALPCKNVETIFIPKTDILNANYIRFEGKQFKILKVKEAEEKLP